MLTLRIKHAGSQVEAALEGCGPRLTEPRPFSFTLSAQDAEDIRWYLEQYPIYPVEPQPKIAGRIRQRMDDVGRELFRHVLAGSDVWVTVRGRLGETRIEIETALADALVPWELKCAIPRPISPSCSRSLRLCAAIRDRPALLFPSARARARSAS